ncbi:hypothetical protein [Bradyrhizobium sp. USDA 4486]
MTHSKLKKIKRFLPSPVVPPLDPGTGFLVFAQQAGRFLLQLRQHEVGDLRDEVLEDLRRRDLKLLYP